MNLYKKFLSIADIVKTDNVFVYAAQASFFIIIATIPFIMLLISLAQYILPIDEEVLLQTITPFLPQALKSTAAAIIDELFFKSALSITSITAVSALWTASRGIAAIERGIRGVYRTPSRPNLFADLAANIFYTITFVVIAVLMFVTMISGTSLLKSLDIKSPLLHWLFSKSSFFKWILTFSLITVILAFIYLAFSGRKMHIKRHFPGAIFTSVVWSIFSLLFSFYINNFANYSYVYGSLATIVLLMLWLYFSMIIFLMGAELNVTVLVMKIKKRDFSKAGNETDENNTNTQQKEDN